MSMIEGIGDEVVHFLSLVIVGLLGVVAWWSTGIRERPLIRTVLILEHRSPAPGTTDPVPESGAQSDRREAEPAGDQRPSNPETLEEPLQRAEERTGSGDLIKQRRLAYFAKPEELQPSNVHHQPHHNHQQSHSQTNESTSGSSRDTIRVRLKYLNDDQKLVQGSLQEMLGDFKRRHFSVELSADKLVRLIFNGQMLQSDDQTLGNYGFYDNCVVHCLVHARRSNPAAAAGTGNPNSRGANSSGTPAEWNLGLVLYACVSLILGFGWFVRYHYAQLFTMSTTAGLIGLTSIFAVSVIGLYMPDQEPVPSH